MAWATTQQFCGSAASPRHSEVEACSGYHINATHVHLPQSICLAEKRQDGKDNKRLLVAALAGSVPGAFPRVVAGLW